MPQIESLNHVALEVNALEPARTFYRDVVGLQELPCPQDALAQGIRWFRLQGDQMLHLIENPNALPGERAHFALAVADVSAWREHLAAHGVELLEPKLSLYNAERVFVRDPSGNLFEFVKWL